MILYLCRHAIAADATGSMSDADRALTAEGIRKFREAAKGFVSLEPDISHIFSSPLLRARQTAELLADAFAQTKRDTALEILECLGTAANERALDNLLHTQRGTRRIRDAVAVGHEPQVSAWLSRLCFAGAASGCEFKKGGIAALELADRGPHAKLLWLLQPKHLRNLGS